MIMLKNAHFYSLFCLSSCFNFRSFVARTSHPGSIDQPPSVPDFLSWKECYPKSGLHHQPWKCHSKSQSQHGTTRNMTMQLADTVDDNFYDEKIGCFIKISYFVLSKQKEQICNKSVVFMRLSIYKRLQFFPASWPVLDTTFWPFQCLLYILAYFILIFFIL